MSSPSTKWEDVYKVQTTRIAELERENTELRKDKDLLNFLLSNAQEHKRCDSEEHFVLSVRRDLSCSDVRSIICDVYKESQS